MAHHEPVFHTDIDQHYEDMSQIAKNIDTDAQLWLQATSRVRAVNATRPKSLRT